MKKSTPPPSPAPPSSLKPNSILTSNISMIKRTWLWFRQPVSGLSHLLGAILAIIGMVWLLQSLGRHASPLQRASTLIFCISMIFLYFSSSLYHLLPLSEKGVRRLRKLDHSAIYIFIAGSYTPFCLLLLSPTQGIYLFISVWIIAAAGVAIKLWFIESSRWIRVGIYTGMSLLSLLVLPEVCRQLPAHSIAWLFVGGFAYLIGAIVYATKWPDPLPEVVGFHEIWHGFVMIGGFCHFWLLKSYLSA